jgi:hypothetical protein
MLSKRRSLFYGLGSLRFDALEGKNKMIDVLATSRGSDTQINMDGSHPPGVSLKCGFWTKKIPKAT